MSSENLSDLYFQCQICLESLASPTPRQQDPHHSIYLASMPGANRRPLPQLPNDAALTDVVALATTSCGHLYHKHCLMTWFENCKHKSVGQRSCPACRAAVPKKKGLLTVYPMGPGPVGEAKYHNRSTPVQEAIEEDEDEEDEEDDSMKDTLHKTLVKDHEEILAKYHQIKNEEETKDALILSLKEDNSKKDIEIERLRRMIAETTGQATEPGSKRRKL